ncbi:MAG TPA: efflux RND transporter periplasmic adaptor subunit [Kineosporiaceae bacterium]
MFTGSFQGVDRVRSGRTGAGRAVVVLLLGSLGACSSGPQPDVEVGSVERTTVTEVVEAPANVVARAAVSVTAPATGTIATLDVTDGATVRAGQLLLRIDSPAARQALARAQEADAQVASSASARTPRVDVPGLRRSQAASDTAFADARKAAEAIPDDHLRRQALAAIAAAQADHDAAQNTAARLIQQLNVGLASLGQLSSSLAQAQRAQTRAAVAAAQATVDALSVRAPIRGTVVFGGAAPAPTDTSPDLSSLLQQLPSGAQAPSSLPAAGSAGRAGTVSGLLTTDTPVSTGTPLLTITDVSTLGLNALVDETDVLLVRPGVTADVELDASPGSVYTATVRSVDLLPTSSARGGVSYGVRLTLGAGRTGDDAAAPIPRPGMSAVARLKVRTATDALSVPAAAVFRDGSRDEVWVVEGGAAHRRKVALGAQGDERVQVSSGLAMGDRVVVRGADHVTDGERVGSR